MTISEELRWRGMLQDTTPEAENQLNNEVTTFYVGFDPTADSLHIGNLVPVMLMVHLQRAGHKPIVLVGGATGRVGDPSGKRQERKLLEVEQIEKNLNAQKEQLSRFLDFSSKKNAAIIVNNYDWFNTFSFLDFIRDIGKHMSIAYMMSKDSVKSRLETGMSFTEFTYQLIQGYDFLHLFQAFNCTMQAGGSDQWGNITTGIELIRRKTQHEAHGLTAPLLTKSDGSKFGKSEGGNIWLDSDKTSPYKFYQYWLNLSDEDAEKCLKIFSLATVSNIESIINEHQTAPHLRGLQKALAAEITARIHGDQALDSAQKASEILFGKATKSALEALDNKTFLDVFEGVPMASIDRKDVEVGIGIIESLGERTQFLKSNSEARRALKENAIAVNKVKVGEDYVLSSEDLLNGEFILLQRGKKNYYVLRVV